MGFALEPNLVISYEDRLTYTRKTKYVFPDKLNPYIVLDISIFNCRKLAAQYRLYHASHGQFTKVLQYN